MYPVVRVLFLGGAAGKILGVFRELLSASLFGTGMIASAFRLSQAALLIPLHGFVSDAVNGGFIPNFSLWRKSDPNKAGALFSGMHLVLLLVSCSITFFLFIAAASWVKFLAPGFDLETAEMATNMVRVLAFALPMYALVSLYAATELVTGNGSITAVRASIQSIGLILGTTIAWFLNEPLWIPVGFVLSYLYLFLWGVSVVRSTGIVFNPCKYDPDVLKAALLSAWKIFRVLLWVPIILIINQVVERRVGSELNPESIAALDYARFITETLIVLVAVPFGVAGQATMAAMSRDEFEKQALSAIRVLLIIGVPVSVILSTNSEFLVRLLFQRGAFGESSVQVTSAIISGQAIGLFAALIAYTAQKFLNARGLNSAVLKATAIGAFIGIIMNLSLGDFFGVTILGLSSAVMAIIIASIALYRLELIRKLNVDLLIWSFTVACNIILILILSDWIKFSLFSKLIIDLTYWSLICMFVPRFRKEIINLYNSLLAKV